VSTIEERLPAARSFAQTLGPGIVLAGSAVGVS